MGWLGLIFSVVPSLVKLAEEIFGSGQGKVKKETVMQAANGIVSAMAAGSTGGQKETWEKIAPVVDDVIESSVKVANAFGWDNFEAMKNGQ